MVEIRVKGSMAPLTIRGWHLITLLGLVVFIVVWSVFAVLAVVLLDKVAVAVIFGVMVTLMAAGYCVVAARYLRVVERQSRRRGGVVLLFSGAVFAEKRILDAHMASAGQVGQGFVHVAEGQLRIWERYSDKPIGEYDTKDVEEIAVLHVMWGFCEPLIRVTFSDEKVLEFAPAHSGMRGILPIRARPIAAALTEATSEKVAGGASA